MNGTLQASDSPEQSISQVQTMTVWQGKQVELCLMQLRSLMQGSCSTVLLLWQ